MTPRIERRPCRNCGEPLPDVQPDSGKRAKFHCSQKCRDQYSYDRRDRKKRPSQHKGSHVEVTAETVKTFWSRVDKTDGCWLWTAAKNSDGYGYFSIKGYSVRAHRWAYELNVGPIPKNRVIDHLCRNRSCVRPDHLELVTNQENVIRGWKAGRKPSRQKAS